VIRGDYKRNEQLILARLDQIQHNLDPAKNMGLGAAVEATEEIRRWVRTLLFLKRCLGGTCMGNRKIV